jgi:3'-phosphoadenosine 5'-phosphosulfate sulfotransferase
MIIIIIILIHIVKSQESTQPNKNSILKTAAKITEVLSQPNEKGDAKQDGIQHIKARLGETLKTKWKNKVMHGQYVRNIDRQFISEEDTFLSLSKGAQKQKLKVK